MNRVKIIVWVDQQTKDKIDDMASRDGLAVSAYIRSMLTRKALEEQPAAEQTTPA